MNIYIFEEIENLTGNYHRGGGATVVANDLAEAEALLRAAGSSPTEEELGKARWHALASDAEPVAYIFPDAGCC